MSAPSSAPERRPAGRRRAVYYGRDSYRIRRWRDAARLTPALGAALWAAPLMWGGGSAAAALIYIFGVWAGLILLAAVIAPRTRPDDDSAGAEAD